MPARTLLFIIVFISVSSVPYKAADSVSAGRILSQRHQMDEAFQHHDAKQLAALFSSACHFTTAALHVDGGDALEHSHEALFLKRPDVTLVHQTDRIVVDENWDVASERGEWVERWTEKDGITELRGSYLGLWRRENSEWRESDEMLVPEACKGGSYCR